jgi:hypothetical protein
MGKSALKESKGLTPSNSGAASLLEENFSFRYPFNKNSDR